MFNMCITLHCVSDLRQFMISMKNRGFRGANLGRPYAVAFDSRIMMNITVHLDRLLVGALVSIVFTSKVF
jgi:hypothetical protein